MDVHWTRLGAVVDQRKSVGPPQVTTDPDGWVLGLKIPKTKTEKNMKFLFE